MRFSLPFLILLVSGCGYSLEIAKLEEPVEDPITLIQRDIRKIKAAHRVALFGLSKEQNDQLKQLRADLEKTKAFRHDISQLDRKLQETRVALSRRNADIDERISEMEVHHRLIQGSIEEESNRLKETSSEANRFVLKELEIIKNDVSTQEGNRKKLEKAAKEWVGTTQKKLQAELAALREKEKSTQSTIAADMDFLKSDTREMRQSLVGQSQAIKALSGQISQLIEKVLPAVNKLGERMDALEWRLKKLDRDIDLEALNRRLTALSDAVDVQRQSLEMLGNTLTPQVDEQRALLRKTMDRLKKIGAESSSKGK